MSTGLFLVKPAARVVLLCAPQTRKLGEQLVRITKSVSLGQITWDKFPDGFPNIFVHDVEKLKGCQIIFLACFDLASSIFEQMSVLCSLPQYAPLSIKIILPFFPVGTMERVDREGEIATARTLARILSSVPPCRGGPMDLVIYDIHALQERFYFGDSVIPVLESAVPLLLRRLERLAAERGATGQAWTRAFAIGFPDEGAYKRYNAMFVDFDTIVCIKVRQGNERKITIKEGDAAGRHVVLVDDMIQSGGTLLECGKAILSYGAASVSAFCTHGVFPKRAWQKFRGGPFAKVWVTDSCPMQVAELEGVAPFEVLSLAPLLAPIVEPPEPGRAEPAAPRLSRL
uniref:Phosphoribosyltransferase domain-containing protein n=1 Tax=Cryptomonas curvata TaxID=233186 RepID=A0A7S0M3Y7_9CRYP|mmetsp:Transcript_23760/g.49684  ORF Transcript_23760/g.49684 Transcript_23760/m.49684 type:complete len:343 (+) Transcript_23760:63-1091(+)